MAIAEWFPAQVRRHTFVESRGSAIAAGFGDGKIVKRCRSQSLLASWGLHDDSTSATKSGAGNEHSPDFDLQ